MLGAQDRGECRSSPGVSFCRAEYLVLGIVLPYPSNNTNELRGEAFLEDKMQGLSYLGDKAEPLFKGQVVMLCLIFCFHIIKVNGSCLFVHLTPKCVLFSSVCLILHCILAAV